jgi:hypothetical protein
MAADHQKNDEKKRREEKRRKERKLDEIGVGNSKINHSYSWGTNKPVRQAAQPQAIALDGSCILLCSMLRLTANSDTAFIARMRSFAFHAYCRMAPSSCG